MAAPTLAVWKFASCDGCQLTLLDCEDELLTLAERVQISTFLEASSAVVGGPYDVSLVEGSITRPTCNASKRSASSPTWSSRSVHVPPPVACRPCVILPTLRNSPPWCIRTRNTLLRWPHRRRRRHMSQSTINCRVARSTAASCSIPPLHCWLDANTFTVGALTRVEGEGALRVALTGDTVHSAELKIYEPPRFFEAFLRGRAYTEPPDITARVCGICPVAYQVSACNAIEEACGVSIDPELVALRRLLYCGEWIHSHVLHIYLLHAPDFLGYPDAISLAKDRRDFVERGLALKKAGNRLMKRLGGRAIHPINVRLGGF